MALSLVQYAYGTNTTTSSSNLATTVTFAANAVVGRLIVVLIGFKSDGTASIPAAAPTISISGSATGGAYTAANGGPTTLNFGTPAFDMIGATIYYGASGSGTDVTVTAGNLGGWGGTSEIVVVACEISGQDVSTPCGVLIASASGTANAGPIPPQTTIPAQGKMVLGLVTCLSDSPSAVSSNYLLSTLTSNTYYDLEWKTVTPGATDGIQWTSGGSGMQWTSQQVVVYESIPVTPSALPLTRFARLNQGLLTR